MVVIGSQGFQVGQSRDGAQVGESAVRAVQHGQGGTVAQAGDFGKLRITTAIESQQPRTALDIEQAQLWTGVTVKTGKMLIII